MSKAQKELLLYKREAGSTERPFPSSWKGTLPSLFIALHSMTHTLRPLACTAQPIRSFWDSALWCEIQPQGSWVMLSWAFFLLLHFRRAIQSWNTKAHGASPVAIMLSRPSIGLVCKILPHMLLYEKFFIPWGSIGRQCRGEIYFLMFIVWYEVGTSTQPLDSKGFYPPWYRLGLTEAQDQCLMFMSMVDLWVTSNSAVSMVNLGMLLSLGAWLGCHTYKAEMVPCMPLGLEQLCQCRKEH